MRDFSDPRKFFTWTIAKAASASGVVDTEGCLIGSVSTPDDFEATTIALGITCCDTADGTFLPLRDEVGVHVTVTVTAASALAWRSTPDISQLIVPRYWKLTALDDAADPASGVSQATALRTGKLCGRPFA